MAEKKQIPVLYIGLGIAGLIIIAALAYLMWPSGENDTTTDDQGISLFGGNIAGLTKNAKGELINSTHTATKIGDKYVLIANAPITPTAPVQDQTSLPITVGEASAADQTAGEDKLVAEPEPEPETSQDELAQFTEYLDGLPTATDDEFSKASKTPAVKGEEDTNDIGILAPGDSEKIGQLVAKYGISAVWQAVEAADQTTSIFLWQKEGYANQIKVAEKKEENTFSTKIKWFEIDADGNVDEIEDFTSSKISDGGKLYGINYNFK